MTVFVDVDDTLVRTVGRRRMPIVRTVAAVRLWAAAGETVYLWSRGGGEYARTVADELGIAGCCAGFLPKPDVLTDPKALDAVLGPLGCEVVGKRGLKAGTPAWRWPTYRHHDTGAPATLELVRSGRNGHFGYHRVRKGTKLLELSVVRNERWHALAVLGDALPDDAELVADP